MEHGHGGTSSRAPMAANRHAVRHSHRASYCGSCGYHPRRRQANVGLEVAVAQNFGFLAQISSRKFDPKAPKYHEILIEIRSQVILEYFVNT
jgi:hypothetical protein